MQDGGRRQSEACGYIDFENGKEDAARNEGKARHTLFFCFCFRCFVFFLTVRATTDSSGVGCRLGRGEGGLGGGGY